MEEIIELAKKIGLMLREIPEYSEYLTVREKYEKDDELQTIIGEFNLKKLSLNNEMDKGDDRNDALIATLQEEMRVAYTKAAEHPTMVEFFNAKEKFESALNNVYSVIQYSLTGENPGSCSGDCSSCGGCH